MDALVSKCRELVAMKGRKGAALCRKHVSGLNWLFRLHVGVSVARIRERSELSH